MEFWVYQGTINCGHRVPFGSSLVPNIFPNRNPMTIKIDRRSHGRQVGVCKFGRPFAQLCLYIVLFAARGKEVSERITDRQKDRQKESHTILWALGLGLGFGVSSFTATATQATRSHGEHGMRAATPAACKATPLRASGLKTATNFNGV